MDEWGPADWSVVLEGVGALLLGVVALAAAVGGGIEGWWHEMRETFRRTPPSDPANRVPYRRPD